MSESPREPIDAVIVDEDGQVLDGAEETVDGELVPEDARSSLAPVSAAASGLASVSPAAVQAAAAAATGFVAGAATLAIVHRRGSRRQRAAVRRRAADALPILGTRSFLIDVHMLRSE